MFEKQIKKYEKEFLEDLYTILKIDSVLVEQPEVKEAPFGYGNVEALKTTLKIAERMGFKTYNCDNVAGHIEFGEGEEILAVLCHLDVVPTGDGWTNPPFEPIMKDGVIYARGVNDDKGPLISSLYAMKILKDMGFKPNKRIRLIVGTDEETGSRGLHHYLQVCEKPNYGFSPDADFPLIYAEKGIMSIDIESNEKLDGIEYVTSGDRYNVVPEKAQAKLNVNLNKEFNDFLKENNFKGSAASTLEVLGTRAHGMEPRNGDNAMLKMFKFLNKHFNNNLMKFTSECLYDSRLTPMGLNFTQSQMGDLTCNVAVCDIKDGFGKVGLNFRFPIEWDKDAFIKKLQAKCDKYNLHVNELGCSYPHYVNPESEFIKKLHKAYVECTGDNKTPLLTTGGGTYARSLGGDAVAFGANFPGREEVAHNKDEYMSLEDLEKACDVYMYAIKSLCE